MKRFCFLFQKRHLHLQEYRSKEILRRFGLNVQRGGIASTPEEVFSIANQLKLTGANELIIKSQILAGGRGKGMLSSGLKGGVKICSTAEQAKDMSSKMIGYRLVTHQTTADGEPVDKVLVLEGVNIVNELYLAIVLDAATGGPVLVVSKKGGVDIEEVAKTDPDAVIRIPISDPRSISRDECFQAAKALGLANDTRGFPLNVADQIERLYDLFVKADATTVEINPLAITDKCTDHIVCIDAKLNFDDNARFRQQEILAMEDTSRIDPRELRAQQHGLSFVAMNGNIGCLVNGAGLAMATMDIVKFHGGEPANFLDVGGGASVDQVTEAFKIIQSDANVKVIFVNIFGGIMRCDIIAQGLVTAANATNLSLPLIIRLVGNRVKQGKEILRSLNIKYEIIDDLEEAAKAACKLAT